MSMRIGGLKAINLKRSDERFTTAEAGKPISEIFGKLVFDNGDVKKYLVKDAYVSLIHSLETGKTVEPEIADMVANGMKNWAMDNGATHYSHWFQPLTGKTAEKHDSFFTLANGKAIEEFNGTFLIQQEPDGSSFPNGGLRETHSARGYTVWDPSSPAFIRDSRYGKTLCIPAIFVSYTGESIDLKTTLLKSIHALDKAATRVARYFDESINKVYPTLGWEQEYFVVDEDLFNARPDLLLAGRTLFGNASARGQQLDDHYFASIPERVHEFMLDFEQECHKIGIPIRTRHNEVAPTQFECAPMFEEANIAADHNQLLMDMIDRVAKRHKLRALLHEKPYKGINGSGKHNNWSLMSDTGKNLLEPGDNPRENLSFLTFFITTIAAVYKNSEIIRASISSSGNEHRLGANEAPPAIISVFTGEHLQHVLDDFKENKFSGDYKYSIQNRQDMVLIPPYKLDKTDRNRTSPFPFTGNKFEFRAVGSSLNVSKPMMVLNSSVADQLNIFADKVDGLVAGGKDKNTAIEEVLREILTDSEKIIFNGDNYSDDWVKEAEKRGLPNVKSTPEAFKAYIKKETIELFERNKIMNERELKARYNVYLDKYISNLEIESLLVEEIANTYIIPAVVRYQNKLIENVKGLKDLGLIAESETHKKRLIQISDHLEGMLKGLEELAEAKKNAMMLNSKTETAHAFFSDLKPLFDVIRTHADKLELLVDDNEWPLPKYRELLFLH